jgi:hypothetical protein
MHTRNTTTSTTSTTTATATVNEMEQWLRGGCPCHQVQGFYQSFVIVVVVIIIIHVVVVVVAIAAIDLSRKEVVLVIPFHHHCVHLFTHTHTLSHLPCKIYIFDLVKDGIYRFFFWELCCLVWAGVVVLGSFPKKKSNVHTIVNVYDIVEKYSNMVP